LRGNWKEKERERERERRGRGRGRELVIVFSVNLLLQLYHMDAEVQLVEILLLLEQVRQLIEKSSQECSFFLCGDFNCCPLMPSNRKTDLTALYQFLSEGSVSPQHEEMQNLYKSKVRRPFFPFSILSAEIKLIFFRC
jgi:hypothetical protein